jgi:gas vesicle protein
MDDERSVVALGAVVGAALGALAGYLFLTERGRRLRADLEPRLGAFVSELAHLQATVGRAGDAATEGLHVVRGVAGHRRN